MQNETEVVATTDASEVRTDVVAGMHSLVADEPLAAGGTDSGPSPYELLAAALASCTTMTLKMYAAFKKIELESVTVSVTHNRIHAADCADCESTNGRIDEFRREITLVGNLDDRVRQRMLEIAEKCPVHKTLHGEIRVRSTLA